MTLLKENFKANCPMIAVSRVSVDDRKAGQIPERKMEGLKGNWMNIVYVNRELSIAMFDYRMRLLSWTRFDHSIGSISEAVRIW
jgi:hypothetical protein